MAGRKPKPRNDLTAYVPMLQRVFRSVQHDTDDARQGEWKQKVLEKIKYVIDAFNEDAVKRAADTAVEENEGGSSL